LDGKGSTFILLPFFNTTIMAVKYTVTELGKSVAVHMAQGKYILHKCNQKQLKYLFESGTKKIELLITRTVTEKKPKA
jgi:hypothetical protein